MSSSEDVRRSYDEVANEYARRMFDELAGKPVDRQLLDRFADETRGSGFVADVGCGPGHVARYLHERGIRLTRAREYQTDGSASNASVGVRPRQTSALPRPSDAYANRMCGLGT
jgi:hypothetical protein